MAAFSKAYLAGLLAVLTGAAVLAGCGTDSTSSSSGGGTTIQIWEGYTQVEAKAFAHLDLVDDVASAGERLGAVGRGRHGRAAPGLGDDAAGQRVGVREPPGVDVVQGQVQIGTELAVSTEVRDDVAGEFDAAGPDERHLDHSL